MITKTKTYINYIHGPKTPRAGHWVCWQNRAVVKLYDAMDKLGATTRLKETVNLQMIQRAERAACENMFELRSIFNRTWTS